MIRVYTSNSLDSLVDALAERLPQPDGDASVIFDDSWLLVPSHTMATFVELGMARRRNIAGNLETSSLKDAVVRLCASARGDVVVVQPAHILGELLSVFEDLDSDSDGGEVATRRGGRATTAFSTPALAPFVGYLRAAGPSFEAHERRRVQLAQALAATFDEWSQGRPELVKVWRLGGLVSREESATLEIAERELWKILFGREGRFERRGSIEKKRFVTVADVLDAGVGDEWRPPRQVHVFACSNIPRAYFPILQSLGRDCEVMIYAPNPCREFWEDMDTAREARLRATHPETARRGADVAASLPVDSLVDLPADSGEPVKPQRGRRSRRSVVPEGQLELAGLARGAKASAPSSTSSPSPSPVPLLPSRSGSHADDSRANPLLTLWGRAALPTLRALGELVDGDFDSRFLPPRDVPRHSTGASTNPAPASTTTYAPASLLEQLQADVLNGSAPDARPPPQHEAPSLATTVPADPSLKILGAPDPRREWESIAAEIWAMMRADGTLRFSDIAVLVTGSGQADDPYFTLPSSVFGEAHDLPFTWVAPTLASTSAVGEALLLLLDLFQGNFNRRAVLDVLTHPNVRARAWGMPSEDAGPISIALCEALGVAHGTDRTAFDGTYVTDDVFNWDQAIRRIALGVFAAGPRSGVETPVRVASACETAPAPTAAAADAGLVPAEIPEEFRHLADDLALSVRSLIGDAAFAKHARLPLADWSEVARALLDAYVGTQGREDEAARLHILDALDEWGARIGEDVALSLHAATALIRDVLAGLRVARGQRFGAGVVIGSLHALRSLPFRVIFVAGLNAQRFPAAERRNVFDPLVDLREDTPTTQARPSFISDTRLPAEPTARETDRHLFLQALLAARETLVLTYVDRDPFTAEPTLPSAVVTELTDVVKRHYGRTVAASGAHADVTANATATPNAAATREERVPLHRDEDPRVCAAFPDARAEAQARAIGDAIRSSIPEAAGLGGDALIQSLSPDVRRALAPLLGTIDTLGPADASGIATTERHRIGLRPHAPVIVRLADLVRFLCCPLQGSARFFLGLRDVDDGAEARDLEDEPMDVTRRLDTQLLTEVFFESLLEPSPSPRRMTEIYDRMSAHQRFVSKRPTGLFQHHAHARHLENLNAWGNGLMKARGGASAAPTRRIQFGRPELAKSATEFRPAIQLTISVPVPATAVDPTRAQISVEIHGTTSPLVNVDGGLAWVLLSQGGSTAELKIVRQRVQALIDSVAWIATGTADEFGAAPGSLASLHLDSESAKSKRHPTLHSALTAAGARAYLQMLVGELLGGVQPILFPCEAVDKAPKSGLALTEQIAFMRGDSFYRERMSTAWGPVPDPFDYPIPDADTARSLRQRRFDLLYGPESVVAAPPDLGLEDQS